MTNPKIWPSRTEPGSREPDTGADAVPGAAMACRAASAIASLAARSPDSVTSSTEKMESPRAKLTA